MEKCEWKSESRKLIVEGHCNWWQRIAEKTEAAAAAEVLLAPAAEGRAVGVLADFCLLAGITVVFVPRQPVNRRFYVQDTSP